MEPENSLNNVVEQDAEEENNASLNSQLDTDEDTTELTRSQQADQLITQQAAQEIYESKNPELEEYQKKYSGISKEDAYKKGYGPSYQIMEEYNNGTLDGWSEEEVTKAVTDLESETEADMKNKNQIKEQFIGTTTPKTFTDKIVSAAETAYEVLGDLVDSTIDIGKGIATGPAKALYNTADLAENIVKDTVGEGVVSNTIAAGKNFITPNKGENLAAQTPAGILVQGISQFVSSWVLFGRALSVVGGAASLARTGKLAEGIIKGFGADFIGFSGQEGRMTDFVNRYLPDVAKQYNQWLATDPTDGVYESRFKQGLEGAILGVAVTGAIKATKIGKPAVEALWSIMKPVKDAHFVEKKVSQFNSEVKKGLDLDVENINKELKKLDIESATTGKKAVSENNDPLLKAVQDVKADPQYKGNPVKLTFEEIAQNAEKGKSNWTPISWDDILNNKFPKRPQTEKGRDYAVLELAKIETQAVKKIIDDIPAYRERIRIEDPTAIDDFMNRTGQILLGNNNIQKYLGANKAAGTNSIYTPQTMALVGQEGGGRRVANDLEKLFTSKGEKVAIDEIKAGLLQQKGEDISKTMGMYSNASPKNRKRIVSAIMDMLEDGQDPAQVMSKISSFADKSSLVLGSLFRGMVLWSPGARLRDAGTTILTQIGAIGEGVTGRALGGVNRVRKGTSILAATRNVEQGLIANVQDELSYSGGSVIAETYGLIKSYVDLAIKFGKEVKTQTKNVINPGVGKKREWSFAKNMNDYVYEKSWDSLRPEKADTGFNAEKLGLKKEGIIGTPLYYIANGLGSFLRVPGSVIETTTHIQSAASWSRAMHGETYRKALIQEGQGFKESLKSSLSESKRLSIKPTKESANSYNLYNIKGRREKVILLNNLNDAAIQRSVMQDAISETLNAEINSDTLLGSLANVRNQLNSAMPFVPAGDYIAGFTRTNANIIERFMLDRSPLALRAPEVREAILKGGAEGDKALGLVVFPVIVGYKLFQMAAEGKLTGRFSGQAKNKTDVKNNLEIPRESINIGGQWIPYSNIEAVAPIASFVSNLIELTDKDKDFALKHKTDLDSSFLDTIAKTVGYMGVSFLQTGKEMSGFENLLHILDDFENETGYVKKTFGRAVSSSVVPSFAKDAVKTIRGAGDEPIQQKRDVFEMIKEKAGLPTYPVRDAFGREQTERGKKGYFMAAGTENWQTDDVYTAMFAVGFNPRSDFTKIKNAYLDYEQQEQYAATFNKPIFAGLTAYEYMKERISNMGVIDPDLPAKDIKGSFFNGREIKNVLGPRTPRESMESIWKQITQEAQADFLRNNEEVRQKIIDLNIQSTQIPAASAADLRILPNLT